MSASLAKAAATTLAVTLVALACAGQSRAATGPCATGSTTKITHVVLIVGENHSYNQMIGSSSMPYLSALAGQCAAASNYHNTDHPSAPNYIELTSGQVQGAAYSTDCNYPGCPQTQGNVFKELESAGKSWRSYAESSPGDCQVYDTALYAQRHVPAAYYTDVHSTTCPKDVVPMTTNSAGGPTVQAGSFYNAVEAGTLPALSFVTPNLCDDAHSVVPGYSYCSSNELKNFDNWLKAWVPFIIAGPNYRAGNTLILILTDEGSGKDHTNPEACWDATHASTGTYPSCWAPLVLVAPRAPRLTSTVRFNHYNLLNAICQLLGVPTFPGTAKYGTPAPGNLLTTFGL
jgi:hypothetical protein